MNVFLTGGTGFIGMPLARALLARGWKVTALVRDPASRQAQALAQRGAACVAGDVTARDSMRDAMRGADVVIHNAGFHEYGVNAAGRRRLHAVNVEGTDNTLGLAAELGVPRAVYVSSTMHYGGTGPQARDETYRRTLPFRSCYERSKAQAHEVAESHAQRGLPLVIVCPNAVVGVNDYAPYGYFLRLYLNGLMAPFAWGPETIMSHVHVDDAAEGIALAAQNGRPGQTYLLAGEAMRVRDVTKLWMEVPGGFKVRLFVPHWLAKAAFAPLEPLQRALGLPAVVSRETVAATIDMNFSSAKAQRELGWRHRPAAQMWRTIVAEELELLTRRRRRGLIERLRPAIA